MLIYAHISTTKRLKKCEKLTKIYFLLKTNKKFRNLAISKPYLVEIKTCLEHPAI